MALSLWAFGKVGRRDVPLFSAASLDLKRHHRNEYKPIDVSMILWSFSAVEMQMDTELFGNFVQYVTQHCRQFPRRALLVTCLAFARMGFAQQPVLIELYRSLYAQLPELAPAQVAFSFFLFSVSGVRDDALVQRFVFECRRHLEKLSLQDLSNVLLALSRVAAPKGTLDADLLRQGLRAAIVENLPRFSKTALLTVHLTAPIELSLSRDENLKLMEAMTNHLQEMDRLNWPDACWQPVRQG